MTTRLRKPLPKLRPIHFRGTPEQDYFIRQEIRNQAKLTIEGQNGFREIFDKWTMLIVDRFRPILPELISGYAYSR